MYEAEILKAICNTMICEKCPYKCKPRERASMASCVTHWSETLSKINTQTDWKLAEKVAMDRIIEGM